MEHQKCRTPRWVRGLKFLSADIYIYLLRRTPRWVRGLKSIESIEENIPLESHPTMGAWIEISIKRIYRHCSSCRTPRWVRGLKFLPTFCWPRQQGRTPRWVRGLKSRSSIKIYQKLKSHPTMGAWIEIDAEKLTGIHYDIVAPHDGCVDWNIQKR